MTQRITQLLGVTAMLLATGCCKMGSVRTASTDNVLTKDELYALSIPERAKLVGKRVSVTAGHVGKVDGDYTFWIGPDAKAVPVVLRRERLDIDAEPVVEVRPGQELAMEGTIQPIRDVIDDLKLTPQEREVFLRNQVYVSANRVVGAAGTGNN